MQRHGDAETVLAHHAVDNAVEKQFQGAGNVAPIARGADDEDLAPPYLLQHTLRIVLGQHATELAPAGHATAARSHMEPVNTHIAHLVAKALSLVLHGLKHAVDVAVLSRTGIYYQNIHFFK